MLHIVFDGGTVITCFNELDLLFAAEIWTPKLRQAQRAYYHVLSHCLISLMSRCRDLNYQLSSRNWPSKHYYYFISCWKMVCLGFDLRTQATMSSQVLGTPAMHIQQCMFSSRLFINSMCNYSNKGTCEIAI